ncbi:MAG: hypothetical protein KGL39_08695 [Patescibacteria group bacterium]|nr:hypothetical protein [Patescibacteria group bacterium]
MSFAVGDNAPQPNPIADDEKETLSEDLRRAALASWVMHHVDGWRVWRNGQFAARWAEYYRLWRGFWTVKDKNRDSERSQLISPALQQAVEMTVAEMEEATFGRQEWIDIPMDFDDPGRQNALRYRDQILDDMDENNVPAAVCEAYLNGALYGTGIGKVMIGRYTKGPRSGEFRVWLEPIAPQDFVIDPAARSVEEALGCAHEIAVPKHKVIQKQQNGVYYKTPVGNWNGEDQMFDISGKTFTYRIAANEDAVYITEYHGLVPKKYLKQYWTPEAYNDEAYIIRDKNGIPLLDDGELVEAIITIANKGTLLRDVENPYDNKDRAIVAYQHETVPAQFWGRGVCEKGYNPQKALDAELRARIDAIGIMAYPIMGADATRLPRGMDMKLRPGRMFFLNGRPSEIMEPISFGNLDPSSFTNTSDLERMVQMGTGAMDSATPLDTARRNETSGGMSQMMAGFIKRAKRTMMNVERNFLGKFVQKALWRYMQFDPGKYPPDFEVTVKSTMGIMAREVEQMILAQLVQVVPPESPLFPTVIKGIVDTGNSPNKQEMLQAIDKMSAPNPQQQQMQQQMQQLEMQEKFWNIQKTKGQAQQASAAAQLNLANAGQSQVKTQVEPIYAKVAQANASNATRKTNLDHAHRTREMHHSHFETMLDAHGQEQDRQLEREKLQSQEKQAAMQPAGGNQE